MTTPFIKYLEETLHNFQNDIDTDNHKLVAAYDKALDLIREMEQRTNILLTHKGYTGSAAYDKKKGQWYGRILNIRSVVTYYAEKSAENLAEAFKKTVDDYIQSLKEINERA